MDALSLARWQFGITTVYHFFFVPLTLGLVWVVAGLETAWYVTGDETWKRLTKFWGKLFLINFAMGVVTGHRAGVPVRDELVRVLALRGRRVRRPARDRGTARLLPRVHLPRAVDLRLGEAAEARAPRRDLAGRDRLQRLGLLDPGRELLHAAADGLRAAQRPRGDGELLGARHQSRTCSCSSRTCSPARSRPAPSSCSASAPGTSHARRTRRRARRSGARSGSARSTASPPRSR